MPPPGKRRAEKLGPKKENKTKSQTQNKKGTKYGGKLGEFMSRRNKKTTGSTLDKTITRNPDRFSPQDVAAAAGRLTNTDEFKDRFGSKNKAAESFAGLINQQQQRLEDRFPRDIFPGGARQRVGDKVAPAGENLLLRNFNEAAGFNPTKGMGIMDSLRSNYEQSGAKFNRNQAIRGIIGSLLGGPLAGIALGNFIPEDERREAGLNEFGMPIFDGRQIDEYRTFGSAPVFEDPEVFDTTSVFPMMRPTTRFMGPPRSGPPRAIRMGTPPLSRITAGTSGVKFGQGSVPRANRFGTAGSQFQNPRMLNQRLSTFGQVGQPFQTRSLSGDLRNFFTKNPIGKRTPIGLGLGALGILSGMTGNAGEATESSGGFMDTLGDVFDSSSEINQQPLFNFDPMEGIRSLFGLSEPAPALSDDTVLEVPSGRGPFFDELVDMNREDFVVPI
jgi:hypothetical protein